MDLHLVDISKNMVSAWLESFSDRQNVSISCASILDLADDTVVSPANSYGEMGGGVDLVYRNHFGREIENTLQNAIQNRYGAYMPIGEAILIETGDLRIPRLIAAPTMFLPEPTSQLNVYKAAQAAFQLALSSKVDRLFCPGFGTGVGKVRFDMAADAMKGAFEDATTPPNV